MRSAFGAGSLDVEGIVLESVELLVDDELLGVEVLGVVVVVDVLLEDELLGVDVLLELLLGAAVVSVELVELDVDGVDIVELDDGGVAFWSAAGPAVGFCDCSVVGAPWAEPALESDVWA